MSGIIAPKVTTAGLLMYLDAANTKSYIGSGTTWTDISGKDRGGILENSPIFSSSNLGTFVFDGVDDRVKLQNTNTWFPISTSAITIDTWIKSPGLASGNTYNGIISLTYGLTLSTISNGNVFFRVYDSVLLTIVNLESTGINCNDNKWHNVVGTNDGTTSKIYIDGVFNTSTPVTFNGNTNPAWYSNPNICIVGWEVNNANRNFNGNISIVKVYNKALSDKEVLQNYNTLKSRYI
jgi:hypothetical protein